jgi:hypothetical protein
MNRWQFAVKAKAHWTDPSLASIRHVNDSLEQPDPGDVASNTAAARPQAARRDASRGAERDEKQR